jgi:glycosyltransferase involved in cell wall biosynthesis
MRIGIVVPHIFMHHDILPRVIFSPGFLALDLVAGLQQLGATVTLFSPGPVTTSATNSTADMKPFEQELAGRGYGYIELLKKHPLTFISLARQVQSELIARAFTMANNDELDVVHIYTNEEDIALPFAAFCNKPVVFTHHDPFNFSVAYKRNFPKYKRLNWLSISEAQRKGMPADTNWLATIYHGLQGQALHIQESAKDDVYVAYLGRIISPKGVHLAIAAVQEYNRRTGQTLRLKIAGKHYAGSSKDSYWQDRILPHIDGNMIEYVGFIRTTAEKQAFLGNACALMIPSLFEEPFGMVMIEALACGTPIIGLDAGAIPEVVTPQTGIVVPRHRLAGSENSADGYGLLFDEPRIVQDMASAISQMQSIDRAACRADFEARFTLERMCREHLAVYQKLYDHEIGLDAGMRFVSF